MNARLNVVKQVKPVNGLPKITVIAGELARQYDEAEEVLSRNNFFSRAGELVTISKGGLVAVTAVNLRVNHLSRLIKWVKLRHDNSGGGWIEEKTDPTKDVADALVQASKWRRIKPLNAIVHHTLLTPDDRQLCAGYDDETGIFIIGSAPALAVKPAAGDVKAAIGTLCALLPTFDFDMADEDRAGALCAILTAVARPALETAPLIMINAPVPGSGKGLLARVIAHFAQASEPPTCVMSEKAEEIHKDLVSRLRGSHPVIFYDEVSNAEIDSPTLRTLATSSNLSSRLLGGNKEETLSTNTVVLMTGNNIAPTADTARRMLQIRLDPRCEKPSERAYDTNPIETFSKSRDLMLAAAMTIQRAFLQSGEVDTIKAALPAVGSFEQWNIMCRLPIFWATGIDPAHRMLAALDDDPRRGTIAEVMSHWYELFADSSITVNQRAKLTRNPG